MKTPVVLIIFRRPEFTRRVIEVLSKVKPEHLLVVADGPRKDCPGEAEACLAARAVIDQIDWECRIERHYSDENLGCGRRPATGISWAFERVEEAIILEDDCVPDESFFPYCEELLERYRSDSRVMHISGCTYREGEAEISTSYYFSKFPACWGWATWRRAWNHFDYNLKNWPELKSGRWLTEILEYQPLVEYWGKEFDIAHRAGEDLTGWDYQWAYACWFQEGLSIFPRRNLVSNIGSGEDATHTYSDNCSTMNLAVFEMDRTLVHPISIERDLKMDRDYLNLVLLPAAVGPPQPTFVRRSVRKGKRILKQMIGFVGLGDKLNKDGKSNP